MVFMDNTSSNRGGGLFIGTTRNVMVKNTVFFDNHATSPNGGGGGLRMRECYYIKLVNLLFNENAGIGTAIYLTDVGNVEIINNTISGNNATSTTAEVYCYNVNPVYIYNSILYQDRLGVNSVAPSVITVDYCLFSNPIPFAIIQTPGSLILPPMPNNPNFVNPSPLSAGGDYHLQTSSLCIDRGNTDYIFPLSATDLEGKPRFVSVPGVRPPIVDMGAFEVP
jgi:hypothetical protein